MSEKNSGIVAKRAWMLQYHLLILVFVMIPIFASAEAVPISNARLGMNLSGPCDWNTELPFVDLFHFSRRWISQREGAAWGTGPKITLDDHGWVKQLDTGCSVETFLYSLSGGHYPAGEYAVLYDGEGAFRFSNAVVKVISSVPGRIGIMVDPTKGAFSLSLIKVNPENYIRNIRVIMPEYENSYVDNPWDARFLQRWKGLAALRFMCWMNINDFNISSWAKRPNLNDASYAQKGIPLELMVDLANRLKADPWFCMPHRADDDYVRNFATLVKEKLDPSLHIYIEYSNEVWNNMFPQSKWAGEQGMKLGFGDKPWEASWRFTAYRSVQIFNIWEDVFGGKTRLVRVLGSQAANPYVSETIAGFQDAYKHADALAIAPYIAYNVSAKEANIVAKKSIDDVMDYIETKALPISIDSIRKQKQAADKYGLQLIAYEGGQHMVGIQGGENNETLTHLFHSANKHPRIEKIYRQYFDAWTATGGGLFCYFASVDEWSKWGSWGILQHADENPSNAPKFMAVMRWAKDRGQNVTLPTVP